MTRQEQIKNIEKDWAENPRWEDVKRNYTAARCREIARFGAVSNIRLRGLGRNVFGN